MSGCEECNFTGEIGYRTPPGDEIETINGCLIKDMGGFSTRACKCVRDLPEVDEPATWWEMETAWERVHIAGIFGDPIELSVSAEVPRTEDGRRAVMRGNRYYPCSVDAELPSHLSMNADDARSLALALLAAAEAADAIDGPCEDAWSRDWSHPAPSGLEGRAR